jgi:DNA-binding phage protein
MPRTVWESKEQKRRQRKNKIWNQISNKMHDKNNPIKMDYIAEQTGRSRQQLYSYMRNEVEPTFEVMAKWFAAAKFSNEEIVDAVKAWQ